MHSVIISKDMRFAIEGCFKFLSDPEAIEMLWQEGFTMLKLLAHPNVMRLIGICEDGATPGIIMPFMENGSLLSYLKKEKDLVVPTDTKMEETKVDDKLAQFHVTDLFMNGYKMKGCSYMGSHSCSLRLCSNKENSVYTEMSLHTIVLSYGG